MSHRQITLMLTLMMSIVCLSPASGRRLVAPQQKPFTIEVRDYPRAVAAAVRQVEKQFGRVITYEDTLYVHPEDIVDVTEQYSRDADRSKRILGMKPDNIKVTYAPRPGSVDDQVEEVLHEVLAQSRAAGNTGDFRIESVPGGYHVIPVAMKGKRGGIETYTSPLDTRITLAPQQRSGLEAMILLAQVITEASGRKVGPGTMPMGRLDRARVILEANNDRAREVLWRVLQSIGPDLSWQVLCDVGEGAACALNVYPVRSK